jgi:branched-chain amino acid transport system permease protein
MRYAPIVLATVSTAAVYALFALAVVLVYRASRIVLFCIGETGMVSAYAGYTVWTAVGGAAGLVLGIAAALLAASLTGVALYRATGWLNREHDHFSGTVVTIAVGIVLFGLMTTLWNGEVSRLPINIGYVDIFGARLPGLGFAVAGIGAAITALLLYVFWRTGLGLETRALADNRLLAQLRGIRVQRRLLTVWVVAALLSGIGGLLSASLSSVSVEGSAVGLSGVVAAIIGGLTSPGGAIVGAFVLAAAENITISYFDARYSLVVPIVFLVILLLLRPSGLSAKTEGIARA